MISGWLTKGYVLYKLPTVRCELNLCLKFFFLTSMKINGFLNNVILPLQYNFNIFFKTNVNCKYTKYFSLILHLHVKINQKLKSLVSTHDIILSFISCIIVPWWPILYQKLTRNVSISWMRHTAVYRRLYFWSQSSIRLSLFNRRLVGSAQIA